MSEVPSFQRIDYSIRTNKNIERKIVFEKLGEFSSVLPLKEYRYLGLGSLWFVDFVLAHRLAGIEKLVSIEKAARADRAEFNKPYDCIEIKRGTSSEVLGKFSASDWAVPTVAWMDYDGTFDADARGDCDKFIRSSIVGSVLIVTVNANRSSYRSKDPMTGPPSIEVLRNLLGDSVPVTAVAGDRKDVDADEFPRVLARSLVNYLSASVRSCGRETDEYPDRFIPLFELCHADNTPMVTVGGMIVSWKQLHEILKQLGTEASSLFDGAHRVEETLDLIPITIKEKLTLDRMLPCEGEEFQRRLSESSVQLPAREAEKYRKFYRYFPVFAEAAI